MARYDLELVRQAADGRWKDILASLGQVDVSILDGAHHGCPKSCHPDAGGKDRFRALDDFDSVGGVLCNQCFSSKNRSGFDALQWLTGEDFKTVLVKVAKFVGVKPIKGRKKASPTEHLEFLPWNRTLVGLWCLKKRPISIETVQRLGWRVAKYRKQYTVIAIPVWGPGLDQEDAVGWVLYRADGEKLPKYTKKDEAPEWVKVKLTAGSQQGLICDLSKWKNQEVTQWGKLEGPSDLGAVESAFEGEQRGWFTTANGAKEKPLDWIIERLKGTSVVVIHDCDQPGQEGATWVAQESTGRRRAGWCPMLAEVAAEVRNVILPFTIEPTHGADSRDYFAGGATKADLLELIEKTSIWERPAEALPPNAVWIDRAEDDARYLAEVNMANYRRRGRNLGYYGNEWYQYKDIRYEHIEKDNLAPRIMEGIQNEFERQWLAGKKDKAVRQVTMQKTREVIEWTKRMAEIHQEVKFGSWITPSGGQWKERPGPTNCVALKNGILALDLMYSGVSNDEYLLPHSPEWFSPTCLNYDYLPEADCPCWMQFLKDAFGDPQQIDIVQKWTGLQLVRDMTFEKIMFIIGQKRSGKGTFGKVLGELLGSSAVATPSLNAFAGQYFLDSLVGKTSVLIPDVRLSKRSDNVVITERLLSISGGDPQDVERKYLPTLNGVKLDCRFTLFSNMLPYFDDSSSAFESRCIFLSMPNSFIGREDLGLFQRLRGEMSGILNWAIVGLLNLRKEGRIEQPSSGLHLKRQMLTMSAPVAQFLQDCVIVTNNHDFSVGVHDLYEKFITWSSERDRVRKMDQEAFRNAISSLHPNVKYQVETRGARQESRILGMQMKSDILEPELEDVTW